MKSKKNVSVRMMAIVLAIAIALSMLGGIMIGRYPFASETVELSVDVPDGIVLAAATASLVYDENYNEMVMLTISVDNEQTFEFVEVEWSKDPFFSEDVLHWGAEKHPSEKNTVTNEIVDFEGDKIYVRIRATVAGIPSEWSTPTEITIRETVDDEPVTSEPVETQQPTNNEPVESQRPANNEPTQSQPPVESQQPTNSEPVESDPPMESAPVETQTPTCNHSKTGIRTIRTIEATCLQNGVTEQEEYCIECGTVVNTISITLNALGHKMGEWYTVTPATSTTEGIEKRDCVRCTYSETRKIGKIDVPHNHTLEEKVVRTIEATCLQGGVKETQVVCIDCHVIVDTRSESTAALGHSYEEVERLDPQIGKSGYIVYECSRCGDRYTVTLPALVRDHTHIYNVTVDVVAPTCTTNGLQKIFCSCGSYVEHHVSALGHAMGDWHTVRPATETETGLEERNCTRCDHSETRELPTLDHTHTTNTRIVADVAPSCTKDGYKTVETFCKSCGMVLNTETTRIDALGHAMGDWHTVRPATETETGLEQRDCGRCDYNETRELPTLDHTHVIDTRITADVAPSCIEDGYKTVETFCKSCGMVLNTETTPIDALGHNMGEWYVVVEPTTSSTGIEQRDCSRCDHYEEREISKLPVDTSNCAVMIQTMDHTPVDVINFTILGRDVDAIRIEVSNGTESDVLYGTIPCTSKWSAHNFTSKVWTTGGTFTANVIGYKCIDGEMVEVAHTSFSIDVTLNTKTVEANDNSATTDIDTNDVDTTETMDTTTENVEIVETVVVENTTVETLDVNLIEG